MARSLPALTETGDERTVLLSSRPLTWVRGEWLFQKPLPKELPTLPQILGKA